MTSAGACSGIGRASAMAFAAAAMWLCSDQASFVTGVAPPVDGGIVAS